jgi:protein TonB
MIGADGFGAVTGATPRLASVRAALCLAAALAAHGLALLLLMQKPDVSDEDNGSSIVFVELAPLPVTPAAPSSDLAPGPLQSASVAEDAPPPPVEQPSQPPPEQLPLSRQATDADSEIVPPQPMETAPEPPPSDVSTPSAPPSVADSAIAAAGPDLGRQVELNAATVARWERSLVARIERFKRYPPQAEGRFGVAMVAFTIDRNGRLLSARIIKGSGSAILDDEGLAILQRASPFPLPPTGVAEDRLSFVLPIRYAPSARQ